MHAIRIDRTRPLCEEPNCGHNRYHPDIAPVVEIGEGEEIALETRDALDGQITPATTVADFASLDTGAVHPLTGPVFVKARSPATSWKSSSPTSSRNPSRSARSCRGSASCVT
jgi:formamidase